MLSQSVSVFRDGGAEFGDFACVDFTSALEYFAGSDANTRTINHNENTATVGFENQKPYWTH